MCCPEGFVRFRAPGMRGYVRREHFARVPAALEALDSKTARLIKDRPKIRAGISDGFFVKCYHYRGWWSRFRHIFRRPRPLTVLYAARAVVAAGVATPAVVGWVRKSRRGMPVADYLLTDALPEDAVFIPSALRTGGLSGDRAVAGLVRMAEKLHRAGIEHGDLSLRNLYLVSETECGVIDLDGCRSGSRMVSRHRRTREVARLVSSFVAERPEMKLEEAGGLFGSAYQECSGIELNGKALLRRAFFLLRRTLTARSKARKQNGGVK